MVLTRRQTPSWDVLSWQDVNWFSLKHFIKSKFLEKVFVAINISIISCTHANNSLIEVIKYLINKGLFFILNILNCKVLLDIQYLSYQFITSCALSMSFNNCMGDVVKWIGSRKCHVELAMGKTDDGRYIATGLSVWPWALLIVIANAVWIGNSLLHSLKGVTVSDGHTWIPGIRLDFRVNNFWYCLVLV